MNSRKKSDFNPGQCRAARGLLGISRRELAEAAGVSLSALRDFETGTRQPRPATLKVIRDTLEAAGILFIPVNGGGEGVRRRTPGPEQSRVSAEDDLE